MTKINIWKNDSTCHFDQTFSAIYSYERFSTLEVNNHLDVSVKIASLIAAPVVVSVQVYSDEKVECVGSGIIVKCNDKFEATVLTSGTLFRDQPTRDYTLKVIVVLQNQDEYEGKVEACDLHFNLALIKIQGEHMLQVAKFRHIYDSIPIGPTNVQLKPLNDLSILAPGDILIALGRYYKDMGDIMVAPGEFSVEDCEFDCKELRKSTCRITKSGIGGPMVNRKGEVVGVNFFTGAFTPFLPSNIIVKWLENVTEFGKYGRPWIGLQFFNLFSEELCILENIFLKFSDIVQGVVVDEVAPNSPAECAGIESKDIIVRCDGQLVKGCLHFFDMIYDKIDKSINLDIARFDGSRRKLSVMVGELDLPNSWPMPMCDDRI